MSAATRAVVSGVRAGAVVAGGAVVVLLVLTGTGAASTGFGTRVDRPAAADAPALRLLRAASMAAMSTTYTGVQYICAWSGAGATSVVVQVRHTAGKGATVEVQPSVTGGAVQLTESDSVAEQVSASGANALADDALGLLRRNYRLSVGAAEPVAGRAAAVVEAHRPDGTIAARMWLDSGTGLLLRREVYDGVGRLLRASAFVELTTGPADPRTAMADGSTSRRILGMPWLPLRPARMASLRAAGWALPSALPGELTRYEARSRSTDGQDVVHLSFSDGLSTVSLFEQRGTLDDRDMSTWRRTRMSGANVFVRDTIPQRVVWASGGTVYTLLADAPADTVRAVVRSLPHRQHDTGLIPRVGRGLARVGSWLNPFG